MDDTQSSPLDPVSSSDPAAMDLAELQAKCEEYLSGWRRAQADYANLQRERDRERGESMKYANTSLLQSLLPVLDQFAVAMRFLPDTAALPETEKKTWNSWLVGLKAVQSLWDQAATSVGLERISTQGAFDPLVHEAVARESAQGYESGTIIRIAQDGWKLHGKVLRPAQVVVAGDDSESLET